MARSYGGNELEEKVAAGQLLLQSFYEDRERAMRLGGLHHARPGSARSAFAATKLLLFCERCMHGSAIFSGSTV